MAEYFFNKWPFVSPLMNRVGHLTGIPEHARQLLHSERLVVAFPEGARGTGKLYKDRYKLVRFGTGFMRLARKTKTPITLAIEKKLRGVYNVSGPTPVPLSTLAKAAGRKPVQIPEFLYGRTVGRFGLPYLPDDAINHIKYPIVIDNKAFIAATGFEPKYTAKQTMEGFRWS